MRTLATDLDLRRPSGTAVLGSGKYLSCSLLPLTTTVK